MEGFGCSRRPLRQDHTAWHKVLYLFLHRVPHGTNDTNPPIVFNILVLLGQRWPEGTPPFARWVNIFFLSASLSYFVTEMRAAQRGTPAT